MVRTQDIRIIHGPRALSASGLLATIQRSKDDQASKSLVDDFAASLRTAIRCLDRGISTSWSRGYVESLTQPGVAVIRISRRAHIDGRTESELSKLLDHVGVKWYKVDALQTWVIEVEAEAA